MTKFGINTQQVLNCVAATHEIPNELFTQRSVEDRQEAAIRLAGLFHGIKNPFGKSLNNRARCG